MDKELTDTEANRIANEELWKELIALDLMPLVTIAGDAAGTLHSFTGLSPEHTVELLTEALEEAKSRLKTMN